MGGTHQELLRSTEHSFHGIWTHQRDYTHLTRQGEGMFVEFFDYGDGLTNYTVIIEERPRPNTHSAEWEREQGYTIARELLAEDPENIDYEYIAYRAETGSNQAQGSMAAIHEFYAFKHSFTMPLESDYEESDWELRKHERTAYDLDH